MILAGIILLGVVAPLFSANAGKLNVSVIGFFLIGMGLVNAGTIPEFPPSLGMSLAFMGAAMTLSTIRAGKKEVPGVALPSLNRCDGLLTWTCYLVVALMASTLSVQYRDLIISGLIVVGSLTGIAAHFQHRGWNGLLPGGVPSGAVFQGRSWGTFGNPLFFGGYLCLVFPLSVMWALSAGHWWASVPAAIMAWALITSGTRSAWLGTALSVPFVSAKAMLALVAMPNFVPFRHRLADVMKDGVFSTESGRMYIWKATWQKIKERPLVGHGLNRMALPNPDPSAKDYYDSPHNDLLYVLFHLGAIGLVAYLVVWGQAVWGAPTFLLPSFIAYAVWLNFSWGHIGVHNVFWMLVGLASVH